MGVILKQIPCLFLTVFLMIHHGEAYTDGHQRIAQETSILFKKCGYNKLQRFLSEKTINGKTYFQIICENALGPDGYPLANSAFLKSDYYADHNHRYYNYENLSVQCFANAVEAVGLAAEGQSIRENFTYDKIVNWLTQEWKIDWVISLGSHQFHYEYKIADPIVTQNEMDDNGRMLRGSTQHTYVHKEGSALGASFENMTVAPWAGQAEFNLAIEAWNRRDYDVALMLLGRSLHYIQDITVPHHTEMDGNLPDLMAGICGGLGQYKKPSQSDYEGDYVNSYLYKPSSYSIDGYDPAKWDIKNDIIAIQQEVQRMRYIEKCDGLPKYWLFGYGSSPNQYCSVDNLAREIFYPKFIGREYGYNEFVNEYVWENCYQHHQNELSNIGYIYPQDIMNTSLPLPVKLDIANCSVNQLTWIRDNNVVLQDNYIAHPYLGKFKSLRVRVGENDDYEGVANKLVTIAVNHSAMAIATFFYRTAGIKRDVNLAPILYMMLGS
jgi:hypothetical protein